MNITEHEMRGLITGKAMPADIFVGESLAAYLVRKFTNLHAERDGLAAENAALKESREILARNSLETCNEVYCAGYRNTALHDGLMESTGNRNAYPNPIRAMVDEATKQLATPATDAYLNSVRAEGVEILTGKLQQLIDEGTFDAKEIGVAAGAVHEGAQIAAELRAGKDGE